MKVYSDVVLVASNVIPRKDGGDPIPVSQFSDGREVLMAYDNNKICDSFGVGSNLHVTFDLSPTKTLRVVNAEKVN